MSIENLESITGNRDQQPSQKMPWEVYFSNTAGTKEFLAAKVIVEKFNTVPTNEGLDLSDTPETVNNMLNFIEMAKRRLPPGADPEGIIIELRKAGIFTKPIPADKQVEKPVEFLSTKYVTLEKPKQIDVNEDELKILEANLLHDEIEKANIFKNKEELKELYERATESDKTHPESELYYYEFSKAGLLKGGDEEVDADMLSLENTKDSFYSEKVVDQKQKDKLERAKKIATLTERALVDGVNKFSWYGENVTVSSASEFDDIKRGVDDILEIKKSDDESNLLALGIDVTFRGLYSEQFKQKFFKLLKSIDDGQKTKVKYFKNHNGIPMKEFAIPKIVLYFSVSDVKDMVEILKNADDPKMEEELKNSPQKVNIMKQVIDVSTKLAAFAEDSQNNIFRQYTAVINSLKELSWRNPVIKEILENKQDTETSSHLDELIGEFRLINTKAA